MPITIPDSLTFEPSDPFALRGTIWVIKRASTTPSATTKQLGWYIPGVELFGDVFKQNVTDKKTKSPTNHYLLISDCYWIDIGLVLGFKQ